MANAYGTRCGARRYRAPVSTTAPAPRTSAFAAAVFSMLIPGLGQAYQRRWSAALLFAAPPFLLLALTSGLIVANGPAGLVGLLISPIGLSLLGLINIAAVIWRIAATLDAWLRGVTRSAGLQPLLASTVGLVTSLMIGASIHLLAGSYIATASSVVGGIFSPPDGLDAPGATSSPAQWDGTARLNVLLVGIDRRGSGVDFNTDTMIVASVDPKKGSVTMFSIPRDTVDVPVPAAAQSLFGPTYSNKINAYYSTARRHPETFPSGPMPALRALLGNLYGITIDYSVMVDFKGFEKIIDTLGGARITARNPVVDESYPIATGYEGRIRIQVGVHGMTGSEALIFARSRHGTSDFDRAARQQQVIAAVRAQSDLQAISHNVISLASALKDAIKTDFPQGDLPQLLDLIGRITTSGVRSVVFSPPTYQTVAMDARGYVIIPDVAKIRAAVIAAFAAEPTAEEQQGSAIQREAARVWVLNGTGHPGEAAAFASALTKAGAPAVVPAGVSSPDIGLLATRFVVYNGAEARIPATLALLEKLMGAKAIRVTDPGVNTDIEIVTGAALPSIGP